LPQAGIDAAKERLSTRGPMTALFGNGGIVEHGLVEQAVEFVKKNTWIKPAPSRRRWR
jgi:hypothetical protein